MKGLTPRFYLDLIALALFRGVRYWLAERIQIRERITKTRRVSDGSYLDQLA